MGYVSFREGTPGSFFFSNGPAKTETPKFLKTQRKKTWQRLEIAGIYIWYILESTKKTRLLLSTPSSKTTNKTEECNLCWARCFFGLRNWRRHCLQWNCQWRGFGWHCIKCGLCHKATLLLWSLWPSLTLKHCRFLANCSFMISHHKSCLFLVNLICFAS